MPGKKKGPGPSVKRPEVYEKLKDKGMSKSTAAAIANKGRTKKGRDEMAEKAARTRKKEKK